MFLDFLRFMELGFGGGIVRFLKGGGVRGGWGEK